MRGQKGSDGVRRATQRGEKVQNSNYVHTFSNSSAYPASFLTPEPVPNLA